MANSEEKQDNGSQLGETAGNTAGGYGGRHLADKYGDKIGEGLNKAGEKVGGRGGDLLKKAGGKFSKPEAAGAAGKEAAVGSAAEGSSATGAGAAGSTAAGAAGTAEGAAAAGAGGAAAGAGGGAGAGAAAGSVVPGLGTAIGAGVGAVVGKYWKKILMAVAGGIIGCLTLMFFVIIVPLIVIALLLFGGADGGGGAASFKGTGLNDDFCKFSADVATCSLELKNVIIAAGNAFKVPSGVLAGILSLEGPHVMGYDDSTVRQVSAPGAKDNTTAALLDSNVPSGKESVITIIDCSVNAPAMVGPLRFGTPEAAALLGVSSTTYNDWSDQASFAQTAINDGRTVIPCNLKDSLYAGSHKLKISSGTDADSTNPWTKDEVYQAAAAYIGVTVQTDGCFALTSPDFNFCDTVYRYYLAYSEGRVKDDGSSSTPNGWPAAGTLLSLYGAYGYSADDPTFHPGIDLSPSDGLSRPVYSSLTGVLTYAAWTDNCGGDLRIQNTGTGYSVRFLHLSSSTAESWKDKNGEFILAGTKLGETYEGGLARSCSTGTHLHYEVYNEGVLTDPLPYTPGAARGDVVTVGGGSWTPSN